MGFSSIAAKINENCRLISVGFRSMDLGPAVEPTACTGGAGKCVHLTYPDGFGYFWFCKLSPGAHW